MKLKVTGPVRPCAGGRTVTISVQVGANGIESGGPEIACTVSVVRLA